jgi:hypothetical protein
MRYVVIQQQKRVEKESFAQSAIRKRNKRLLYLQTMVELPTFEVWFSIVVAKSLVANEDVSKDVISISTPPLDLAIGYHSMYAFGNHLRVANAESHFSTTNLGVIATFEQECRSHSNDCNPIMASLENVGWIEEIWELNYGRFQIVIFLCNWVAVNYEGPSVVVKHNYYKFTLVNFEPLIPLST